MYNTTGVLVNTSVASCIQDRQCKCFSPTLAPQGLADLGSKMLPKYVVKKKEALLLFFYLPDG